MTHLKAVTNYSHLFLERDLQTSLKLGWRIITIYFAQGVHIAWLEREGEAE